MKKNNGDTTTEEAIIAALGELVGAYAFIILTEEKMFVALDPHGIRPLSLGRLGDAYVVASETCAFNIVGATFEREILPGEMLTISDEGVKSTRFSLREPRKLCAMERSEEHTSELQSRGQLVCRLLLEKKKQENFLSYLEDKTDDVYESEVQQAIKRFLDKHVTTEKEEIIK